jgi:hypothetical protein
MQAVSGVPWALKETDGLCVWNVFDGERGNNTLPFDDITIKFLSTVTIFVRSLKKTKSNKTMDSTSYVDVIGDLSGWAMLSHYAVPGRSS